MNNSKPTDDDLLLAVRYVLNECEATELEAFEARLADDIQAQEALVEAVQIVSLLQSTPTCEELAPRPITRPQSTRRAWQVASLVTLSLGLAAVMFWQSLPLPQHNGTAAISTESPALAQAWTALEQTAIVTEDADEQTPDDATDEFDAASDVPDWLLTAVLVEAEQGEPDDSDPGFQQEETQL